ncbi:nucleoside hydrolase [Planctomycetales bacterium ZRK34]|nr:nucleoside hydrolase [Planctomycetales bacterium ZRK34]
MRFVATSIAVLSLALAWCATSDAIAAPPDPVKLIFDTDLGGDCDDVLALAVIHALQSRGQCELLAVTTTKDDDRAAPFVDAINTFYGRGDIPIGAVRHGKSPNESRYLQLATQKDDGKLRYPRDLNHGADAPEAVSLLRRVLSDQPDHSVVIVQVGFSTNLSRLLDSKPDSINPQTGRELVAKKVKLLSIMAGYFSTKPNRNSFGEYNVKHDLPAAQNLAAHWPTEIVFSGFEVGQAIRYPARSIDNDFKYVAHHPLSESYQLYQPTPHQRPTFDLTSVLYAVEPDGGHFGLGPRGRVQFDDQATTHFTPDPQGTHRYLTVTPQQIRQVRALFVELCTQKPDRLAGSTHE